jgi:hypothetical protein
MLLRLKKIVFKIDSDTNMKLVSVGKMQTLLILKRKEKPFITVS